MNDYGYNGGYGYGAGGYPPKKPPSFFKKLFHAPGMKPQRELLLIAFLFGCSLLVSQAFSALYSLVITSVPFLTNAYRNELSFRYGADIFYSLFCIGLPFTVILPVLRSLGIYDKDLPFEKPVGNSHTPSLIVLAVGVCFMGNIVTNYFSSFMQSFGLRFYSYEMAMEGSEVEPTAVGITVFLLRTALVPALIEEFVFRGVLMQPLRKYGDWFAIGVSAVMFGLMHGNMTQVPFALIAGLSLGYVSIVTGSLWTGIAVHFINNLTAALLSVIAELYPNAPQMLLTSLVTYLLVFAGIAALIVYALKNPVFYRLYPCRYGKMKPKLSLWFLTPTVTVSVILLLYEMYSDIIFI